MRHFLDIPDLHPEGFKTNGFGKIRFYKGGGDLVEWASDQLDETPILANPGDALAAIDDAVHDAVDFIGNSISNVIPDRSGFLNFGNIQLGDLSSLVMPNFSDITHSIGEITGFNNLQEAVTSPVSNVVHNIGESTDLNDTVEDYMHAPLSSFSSDLSHLDDVVNDNVPGGWRIPASVALAAAAPFTGGASLAIGESLLGVGAAGASTVGSAVMGAGMNALIASATGGDVGKAALLGAVSGGIGANSMDIASSLMGGGDSIAGISAISDIANAIGQNTEQVANLITNSVSTAISTAAVNGGDPTQAILNNLASSAIGNYANQIVNIIDPNNLTTAANIASGVAKVGTSAALNGNDIGTALQNSLPQIIGNSVKSNTSNSTSRQLSETQSPLSTASNNQDNEMFGALTTALQNPTDDSRYPTSYPLASANTTGTTSDIGPTSSVGNLPAFTPLKTDGTFDPNVSMAQTEPITLDIGGPGITEDDYEARGFDINQIPTGFKLAPSSATENAVNGVDPNTGAYYDEKLDAWLMPTSEAFEQSTFTPSDSKAPDNATVVAPSATKVLGGGEGQGNVFVPGTPVTEFPLTSLETKTKQPISLPPLSNLNIVPSSEQTKPVEKTITPPLSQPKLIDKTITPPLSTTNPTPTNTPDEQQKVVTPPLSTTNPVTTKPLDEQTKVITPPLSTTNPTVTNPITTINPVTTTNPVTTNPTVSPSVDLNPINNQLSQLISGQDSINTTLSKFNEDQKKYVSDQVKMGVDLTTAINNAQSQNQKQFDEFGRLITSNQAQNQQRFDEFGNLINANQAQNQQQFDRFGNLITTNQAQNQQQFGQIGTQIGNLSNTVGQNQLTTNQALQGLSDTQKAQASALIAQGLSTTDAINAVKGQISGLSNQINANQSTTNQALQGLSDAQKAQANNLIAQGVSTDNAIKAVQGQISGLDRGLSDLTGTVGNIGTQVGDLNKGLASTNAQIGANQDATTKALQGLSDEQKAQVASQVAMGASLSDAILNVNIRLSKQSLDASNAQQNQKLAQIQSSAIASGTQAPVDATGRGALSSTSLDAAPVYGQNTKILGELKQMYPQLSQMNPKLLSQLGLNPDSPLQQAQNTQPPSQQVYVPSLSETNFSDTNDIFNFKSGGLAYVPNYAMGGDVHIPEFVTGATGHYVKGRGDGQSDDIPAMLADGEYVFDADTVAQLGNGSSDAGAKLLDHFRQSLREHKRSAPSDKIPPKASPLMYMKEALKRHEGK